MKDFSNVLLKKKNTHIVLVIISNIHRIEQTLNCKFL